MESINNIPEEKVFIQILKDHLHKQKTYIYENVNWNMICKYSKYHQVEAIVYYQTKIEDLRENYLATLYYSSNRKLLLKQLFPEITTVYAIVKGVEIANFYPVPQLRTMGDVDIVAHNREEFHNAFIKLGYEVNSKKKNWEWHYRKLGIDIELHDRLVYEETVNDNYKQKAFFNNIWDYVHDNKLDWNFHFMFLIYHIKKHLMNSGVGFRQFLDIAVIIENVELDWKWIDNKLEEIELLPFASVVLAFIKKWFNVEGEIEVALIDNDFYVATTKKIFKDGVFGFNNEENREMMVINETLQKGRIVQFKIFIKKIFPSYEYMCVTPHYTWIKNKRILLPVVWIYRWFRGIKKLKSRIGFLKSSFVKKEKIEKREDMYRQWGL